MLTLSDKAKSKATAGAEQLWYSNGGTKREFFLYIFNFPKHFVSNKGFMFNNLEPWDSSAAVFTNTRSGDKQMIFVLSVNQ